MGEETDILFFHLIRLQELTLKQLLIIPKDCAERLLQGFNTTGFCEELQMMDSKITVQGHGPYNAR